MPDRLPAHPPVPLTLEGSSVLHQSFRFDWKAWRGYLPSERGRVIADAVELLRKLERKDAKSSARSALYSQLGHKGDLMLIHFRDSLEELNQVELALAQTPLYDFLSCATRMFLLLNWGCTSRAARRMRLRRPRDSSSFQPEWNAEIAASLSAARKR